MLAHPILLQMKYARIVAQFAEEMRLSYDAALDFFYHSVTYKLMSEGIGDSHCLSDGYLTDDLIEEYTGIPAYLRGKGTPRG